MASCLLRLLKNASAPITRPRAFSLSKVDKASSMSFSVLACRTCSDVPARHHIGEGVVIHVLVVLVWPYHVADVPLIICLHHRAGRPKSGRFQQDLRAGAKEESVISSEAPILPHRIGAVGADVVLHPPGQDGHLL